MADPDPGQLESSLLRETRDLINDLRKIERRSDPGLLEDTHAVLTLVHRISDILNHFFLDVESAMSRVIDVVLEVTGAMRGALLLLDESDEFSVAVARTADGSDLSPGAIRVPAMVTDPILETGQGHFLPDLASELSPTSAESTAEFRIVSALCVPLKYAVRGDGHDLDERREDGPGTAEKVIGAIYVDTESVSNPLSRDGMTFLETIANHATSALRNAKLYMQATRDSLTGLAIRRVFDSRLKEELDIAGRERAPLTLLMTDLDHFKSVNDRLGHTMGDEVLRGTAVALQGSVRSTDLVARYGGEEFALILPGTRIDEGRRLAEKIRERVGTLKIPGGPGRITISVGLAEYPTHTEDAEELVNLADKALYAAKEQGRNRVVVWSESIGRQAEREDKLAGILTGEWAKDYRNVSSLLDILSLINSAEDRAATVRAVVEKMVEISDADRGILLLGETPAELKVHLALDKKGARLSEPVRFSRTLVDRVFADRAPLAVVDAVDDLDGEPPPESVINLEIRSMMCAPLASGGKMFGAIYVDSRRRAQGFLPGDLAFFHAMAAQAAGVLDPGARGGE